jgi:hypothetical protein
MVAHKHMVPYKTLVLPTCLRPSPPPSKAVALTCFYRDNVATNGIQSGHMVALHDLQPIIRLYITTRLSSQQ